MTVFRFSNTKFQPTLHNPAYRMSHTKRNLFILSILLTSLSLSTTSESAVTFALANQGDNTTGFAVVSGGITATFSNPQFNLTPAQFDSDGDGLAVFGDGGFASITSWDVSFDQDVQLESYTVSFSQGAIGGPLSGNETLTFAAGANSSAQSGTDLQVGLRNFSNPFTVSVGQTVSVTATGVESSEVEQFSGITVNPVPEPSASLLLLAGFAAFGMRRSRK